MRFELCVSVGRLSRTGEDTYSVLSRPVRTPRAAHVQGTDPGRSGCEYQDWVGGAFQRVMADGVACQEFVGVFAAPLSGKQETTPQQTETKTAHRSKAA
jgi:hypothetical protein